MNRGGSAASVDVPVGGWLRDGVAFTRRYQVGTGGSASASSAAGKVAVTVPANGAILLASGLGRPVGPGGPDAHPGRRGQRRAVDLAGARSPVRRRTTSGSARSSGGGYVRANGSPVTATSFTITGLPNAQEAYVVVTANDAAGNGAPPPTRSTASRTTRSAGPTSSGRRR